LNRCPSVRYELAVGTTCELASQSRTQDCVVQEMANELLGLALWREANRLRSVCGDK
jgi:hypothetical protein